MGDIHAEKQLVRERREIRRATAITVLFEDGSAESWDLNDNPALFKVYPNQVDIDKKNHTHFHDFNLHWTQPR